MVSTMKRSTVDDGVTIAYRVVEGVEPAVVVLHGLAGSSREFLDTAEGLAGRRVILLDQRGHGHRAHGDFFRSWAVPFVDRQEASAALGEGPLERAWVEDLDERADGLHPRFDADVMQATIEAVGEPRWAEWESVATPTLVPYADGGMFSEEQKAEFVRRGRAVRRVDLLAASHDAHLDAFDQWLAVLRSVVAD
jgi:pimeloyl-ACP methyl ester carboxylesterase